MDTSENTKPDKTVAATEQNKTWYTLAAYLLTENRNFVAMWYGLLVAPELLATVLDIQAPYPQMALGFIERVIKLLFLYFATRRCVKLFGSSLPTPGRGALTIYFALGLMLWLPLRLPRLLTSVPQDLQVVVIAMSALGAAIAYSYYFVFFPPALGCSSLTQTLAWARSYLKTSQLFPVKAEISALGLMLIFTSLAIVPAPDGADIGFLLTMIFFGGIGWVVSSFTAIAIAITYLEKSQWRSFELMPYREDRLNTLAKLAPSWLATVLNPKRGLAILLAGVFLWVGNNLQFATYPPRPKITSNAVSVSSDKLTLKIEANDEQYRFRGFLPAKFHLAGANHVIISGHPDSVKIDASAENYMLKFPHGDSQHSITIVFTCNRTGAELLALKDLYLWYGGTKVLPVEMAKATG